MSSSEDAVYWRVVLSAPLVIANEPGRYRCDWVEATYLGAQQVEFEPTLPAKFEIRHENILNPRATEWVLGRVQGTNTSAAEPERSKRPVLDRMQLDRDELMDWMENAATPEEVAHVRAVAGGWLSAENTSDPELEKAFRRFEKSYPDDINSEEANPT